MSILMKCDCGNNIRAGDQLAGKRIKCPICKKVIVVPEQAKEEEFDQAMSGFDDAQAMAAMAERDAAIEQASA